MSTFYDSYCTKEGEKTVPSVKKLLILKICITKIKQNESLSVRDNLLNKISTVIKNLK